VLGQFESTELSVKHDYSAARKLFQPEWQEICEGQVRFHFVAGRFLSAEGNWDVLLNYFDYQDERVRDVMYVFDEEKIFRLLVVWPKFMRRYQEKLVASGGGDDESGGSRVSTVTKSLTWFKSMRGFWIVSGAVEMDHPLLHSDALVYRSGNFNPKDPKDGRSSHNNYLLSWPGVFGEQPLYHFWTVKGVSTIAYEMFLLFTWFVFFREFSLFFSCFCCFFRFAVTKMDVIVYTFEDSREEETKLCESERKNCYPLSEIVHGLYHLSTVCFESKLLFEKLFVLVEHESVKGVDNVFENLSANLERLRIEGVGRMYSDVMSGMFKSFQVCFFRRYLFFFLVLCSEW